MLADVSVMSEWTTIAIQAGGAIAVCAMFLWFLQKKGEADDKARNEFLTHLAVKDKSQNEAIDKYLEYMRSRDVQSKEIAMNGHEALRQISMQVQQLRMELTNKNEH